VTGRGRRREEVYPAVGVSKLFFITGAAA